MAHYKQLKLPPLKLTVRSSGLVERVIVHRGATEHTGSNQVESSGNASGFDPQTKSPSLGSDLVGPGIPEFLEPTHHELQCKSSVRGWMEIRSSLLKSYTASYAMPQGQLCLLCANHAELLCEQCGPAVFLCKECFNVRHGAMNMFHTPKEWKVTLAIMHHIKINLQIVFFLLLPSPFSLPTPKSVILTICGIFFNP